MTLRRLRLGCGIVLFAYLTQHFINHALLNWSFDLAQDALLVQEFTWGGPFGGLVLYGALLIHLLLGLFALYQRRSLRMGWAEGLRLALGLSIVPLIAHHIVGTRYVWEEYGAIRRYDTVLHVYFTLQPFWGVRQIVIVLVAWMHACIGLHFWLRLKSGYRRLAPVLLSAAVLLPALALLGVLQGERDVRAMRQADPAWMAGVLSAARLNRPQEVAASFRVEDGIYWAYGGALLLVLAARGVRGLAERRGKFIRIAYAGGPTVRIPRGLSVLEASRRGGVPHASVCGGRGRCSTCRVRVMAGADALPPPEPSELAALARLRASPSVRLACQLRPTGDISVLRLLPPTTTAEDRQRQRAPGADTERFVAIMFVDIRQSTALVEQRLPYDVVFLLNHFFETVGGAIVRSGGSAKHFAGDGLMAIFGAEADAATACRQALAAATLIEARLTEMNRQLADELPSPIRIGIGLHAGNVILGEVGHGDSTVLTAIGDPVHVASRLQELTKDYHCQMVVSDLVGETAGVSLAGFPAHEIAVRGRDALLRVRVVELADELV